MGGVPVSLGPLELEVAPSHQEPCLQVVPAPCLHHTSSCLCFLPTSELGSWSTRFQQQMIPTRTQYPGMCSCLCVLPEAGHHVPLKLDHGICLHMFSSCCSIALQFELFNLPAIPPVFCSFTPQVKMQISISSLQHPVSRWQYDPALPCCSSSNLCCQSSVKPIFSRSSQQMPGVGHFLSLRGLCPSNVFGTGLIRQQHQISLDILVQLDLLQLIYYPPGLVSAYSQQHQSLKRWWE